MKNQGLGRKSDKMCAENAIKIPQFPYMIEFDRPNQPKDLECVRKKNPYWMSVVRLFTKDV